MGRRIYYQYVINLIICCLICVANLQQAQAISFQFQRINALDGLSQNSVNQITLDNTGYLWIATDEGLNRYDGYNFLHFRHNSNQKNSLHSSKIQALLPDEQYLWIGTFKGLNLLNTENNEFVRLYPLLDPLKNANIHALAKSSDSTLWIGTTQGLIKAEIDITTGLISQFKLFLNALSINDLQTTSEGDLWIGTDSGLFLYNAKQAFLSPVPLKLEQSDNQLSRIANISTLFLDDENILWVGTEEHGVFYKSLSATHWQSLNKDSAPVSLSSNAISALHRDSNQQLWIGLKQDGIDIYTPADRSIEHITQYSAQNNGLSSDNVTHIFEDKSGIMWIATQGSGINKWNPVGRIFSHNIFDIANSYLDTNAIIALHALEHIYIATQKAIYKLPHFIDGLTIQQIEQIIESPNLIHDITYETSSNAFWYVTDNELTKFDLSTESTEVFSLRADNINLIDIPTKLAWLNGQLLIATKTGFLYRFNTQSEQLTPLPLSQPIKGAIQQLFVDARNNLWVSSESVLYHVGADGTVYMNFNTESSPALSSIHIQAIHEFPDSTIWLATRGGGLDKIVMSDHQYHIESFDIESGLPTNTLHSIQHDTQDFIWLSSNNGLSRFNPFLNQFKNFDQADGLQSTLFNSNVSYQQQNGMLYFASNNGFTRFNPSEIPVSNYVPPIVLTQVKLDNRSITPGKIIDNVYKLNVPYQTQFITIQVASLDFTNPHNNRFAYKRVGIDNDWVMQDNQHTINFNKLPAGNYKLRIRGTNSDGVWNQAGILLYLEVANSPWLGQWAIALYCVLFTLFLAWVIHIKNEQHLERESALSALHQSEEQLKLALWGSGDQLWDWDVRNNNATQSIENLFQERLKYIHPDDQPRTLQAFENHYNNRTEYYEATYRLQNKVGKNYTWVLDRGKIFKFNRQGQPTRFAGTLKNIQTIKETEQKLHLIAQAFEHTSDGAWITDTELKIVAVNHAYKRLTGYHPNEVIGSQLQLISDENEEISLWRDIFISLSANHQWEGEITCKRSNGEYYPCSLNISTVRDHHGHVTHYVGLFSDITYKKQAEAKLLQLANYDTLTSLPNRIHFNERLHHALSVAKKHKEKVAVFFLDLDHFKHVNDTLGHATGDLLLKEVAKRLQLCLRDEDTVARLGGDEFTIILENIQSIIDISSVADKILQQLLRPIHVDGNQLNIGTSIGISIFPDDGDNEFILLQNADTAMYHAKKNGRNNYQFFTEQMNDLVQERVFLESHLRHALRLNELAVLFQPKYDIVQQKIIGAEVLIRWQHSDLGYIPPDKFIPIAEESGLIIDLGEWIIQQACAHLKQLLDNGIDDIHLALNLSAKQFNSPKLLSCIEQSVERYQVPPRLLEIEITEGTIMDNIEHTIQLLQKLKSKGFSISIDDFGTGYSSLSYLKKFPVNTLKIDQSFIRDITNLEEDASIVDSIITLAHNLRLNVIAEGVETAEQYQLLKQLSCDQCQGYLIAKPLPYKAFLQQVQHSHMALHI